MRLKRVRLFGFKTFADRTELSLEGGIIAVVGPNGCGKSNLVDGILWGLGEGNARHLRAQTGQDVIFSGSSRRKGVGFSEVNLLFDNEDGSLPIDTPEVSITRRLTRSGESDYAINRQSCRLRDIYDLLADSGLGRAGYSIVGQKEIDSALSASAEDRRGWIDEAAGVQRYRVRKQESQRRLAQAAEHLTRVADILRELEQQREPLKEEAEVALRYKNILETLREVEIGLLVNEVAKAVREVREAEQRIEETVRISQQELAKADALEGKARDATLKISAVELELDGLRAQHQESITSLERAEANLRLLQQRLEALEEQEKHLTDDATAVELRIKEAAAEVELLEAESAAEAEGFHLLQTELAGAGDETRRLGKLLEGVEAELRKARDAQARKLKAEAERAHRDERLALSQRELSGAEKAIPELESVIEEARAAYAALTSLQTEAQQNIRALEDKLAALRVEEDKDAQGVRRALGEKAALEGRIRGIEATIDAHEGLSQGARAVLEAANAGVLRAKYVLVGEALDVDKDLARAIETALGNSAHDLIVEDQEDAKEAIDWLKSKRAGRATFQPIPLMRPSEATPEMRRLMNERGMVGRASELVKCEPRYRPVIDSLLGRILVAETLDDALRHARTGGWSRIVTLDGEVLHSGGAVTGGQLARQGYGLVQRKADLHELEKELGRFDKVVGEQEKRSKQRQDARAAMQREIEAARRSILEGQGEREEARQFLQTLSDELKTAQREQDRLRREIEALGRVAEEAAADAGDPQEIEARRDELLRALAAKSADESQAETRLREVEARMLQARARLDAGKRRLLNAQEHEEHRRNRLTNLEPERARIGEQAEQTEKLRLQAGVRREELGVRLEEASAQKRALLEESGKLIEEGRAARDNAAAVGDAAHQAELTRARAEARRATALERLYMEYGMTEEDAMEQEGMHEVPPDASSVVNRLRREMRAMGDVNLGAIEAFERLTSRYEELHAQQEDILEGIAQVESSIKELDKMTRDRFNNTFAAVQENFSAMFLKLFGGGEGHLALTDPTNTLESGIELHVTLPGKKRQPLNLLSGGERSLCATAFLLALLKVKPSPLVVLDEVDAPLDGANVERFAAALREFTHSTQFLVITHNPTTIAAADVWAGISMQEPGVSLLLPFTPPQATLPEMEEVTGPSGAPDLQLLSSNS
ncbi:MAG: chromosome segregation protein SMC [Fimbriimonas sp.]